MSTVIPRTTCILILFVLFVAASAGARPAVAGGCPCNGDVTGGDKGGCYSAPDGIPSFLDIQTILVHITREPIVYCDGTPVLDRLDVNCDGRINFCDYNIAICSFQTNNDPACCETVVCGACCINGSACTEADQTTCEEPPPDGAGGVFQGAGTVCPAQNAAIFEEPGGEVFVHIVGPPVECPSGGRSARSTAGCSGPPYYDAWVSHEGAAMCEDFGAAGAPPIPAGFFDNGTNTGSDPFTDVVCLQGVPLGPTTFGDFGLADTILRRTEDPYAACDAPTASPATVDIEIVALSLESIDPITVTYNGGASSDQWDVDVTISDLTPSTGQLTATKEHCNGGTYTNFIDVYPVFTFTKVGEPTTVRVLDVGDGGTATTLEQTEGLPWVTEVAPEVAFNGDICSDFHPGVEQEVGATTACDSDSNGVIDSCEGVSTVPAASDWGLALLALMVLTGGSVAINRRRPSPATST